MGENQLWFGQTLLTYKDKQFHTEGHLRLSLSAATENYSNFNAPTFGISISNNYSKSCNLNIQNAEDLIESFEMAFKKLNGETVSIEKKYTKNIMMIFKIQVDTSNGERVVSIELMSNETDTTKIIVPLKPIFQSFLRRLRFFVENYDRLCSNLLLESTRHEQLQTLKYIHTSIKGLPSQIIYNNTNSNTRSNIRSNTGEDRIPDYVARDTIPDNSARDTIPDSRAPEQFAAAVTELTLDNFDRFIGIDAANIKIPEIENGKLEPQKQNVEIKSSFCEKFINWDLNVLENRIATYAITPNRVSVLYKDLEKELGFENILLPLFSEDEFKSISYLPESFSSIMINANRLIGSPIPSGVPVFYTDLQRRVKPENKVQLEELALDLFMFSGYIRSLRRRLESKLSGANDNKSIFCLNYRCLFDPLYFSFMMFMKRDITVGVVMDRYIYFQKRGVFKRYESLIRDYGLPAIDDLDIKNFVEEFYTNIYGKQPAILELHDDCFRKGEVKLASKNGFTLEQIINEVIPLEIALKMGLEITDKDVVKTYKQTSKVSDEIYNHLTGKQKIKSDVIKEKVTMLYRYVEKFKADLAEQYRDSFLKAIKALDINKYDFSKEEFPLEEFDDRFVKALFVWDPERDPNMKASFTHFSTLVEEEVMTKDTILVVSKNAEPELPVDNFFALLNNE